ncbi:hypothetical protein Agub_g9609 [Astrephomene gubernaculifera]|uniref:3-beta hydroxysteroid dehydrogenase/isomerase domain-containing protein n=1 Tax=Astrephomene gubernaculifera TaxID=47775 RepID=A0AAD3DTR1_9CHLO|nr:hypothetical protein Agub_g9609 [Astrephomene gubernaculifera]
MQPEDPSPSCGHASGLAITEASGFAPTATTRRALITGGSGFLGFRLGTALAKDGIQVFLLDLAPPRQSLPPNTTFIRGSVANAADVDAAFSTAAAAAASSATSSSSTGCCGGFLDAVFHVASYGMSGRELRDLARITAVNVGGTQHVLDACVRYGVPRLVYVSTCNVIFVGKPISCGTEAAPYPPPAAYKDAYSATKAAAERLVLAANGSRNSSSLSGRAGGDGSGGGAEHGEAGAGKSSWSRRQAAVGARPEQEQPPQPPHVLYTCAVRSTGIWGPGETRHQPRVIRMVRAGLFGATFGDLSSLSDWIHVDNLVQLLARAERALRHHTAGPDGNNSTAAGAAGGGAAAPPVAAGQVYYASDGAPINNFLHFKPFIVGLGYRYPSLNVPYWLVYGIAALIEYVWPVLQYIVADPPLTRMEVDKCCVSHWFDISKARRELGYRPVSYDRGEVVSYMRAEGWGNPAVGKAGVATLHGRSGLMLGGGTFGPARVRGRVTVLGLLVAVLVGLAVAYGGRLGGQLGVSGW